jgi:poly-gamma-glutamate capsule biosynthesis protein CapA/YwtB (metallophosphatase superfamily)
MSAVSIITTGDSILAQRVSGNPDPDFGKLVDLLRSSDVAIANLEIVFPGAERHPATTYHGIPICMDPELLSELQWLGFDLYGMGNNHALDYGPEGLVRSMEELEKRQLPFAGIGRTLTEAGGPRYVDAAGTRVALIAAGSTQARLAAAADPSPGDGGRAGICPLRIDRVHYIDRTQFESFRSILASSGVDVGLSEGGPKRMYFPYPDRAMFTAPPVGGFAVEGVHFVPDANPRIETVALESDVDALAASVSAAAREDGIVIVSLHCHEGAGGQWNGETLPEFMQPLAHRLIDAGASAVVNHGPHTLRGVEIYKDRPICYSLSNFIFKIDTVAQFPTEFYEQVGLSTTSSPSQVFGLMEGFFSHRELWDSMVSRFVFEKGDIARVELHPITLGSEPPRGCPKLASLADGRRILSKVAELSHPFGTRIECVEQGDHVVGVVAL